MILCVMTAFVRQVSAQTVNRCEHNGRTVYSQFPCEQKQKSTQVDIKLKDQANSRLTSNLIWKTYDVTGLNYAALITSMGTHGPKVDGKSFHGLAKWHVKYNFTTKQAGRQCRFSSVDFTIDGEVLMPRWLDEVKAPADLRQRWTAYYAALKTHEEGHIQNGRELALLVRERFLGMGDMDCDQSQNIAQTEFNRIYNNIKDRDKDYDRRTQHGATQGASYKLLENPK
jgi:predicted secreted Zn-dependent protease